MRKLLYSIFNLMVCAWAASLFTSCDVHEWPDLPERVSLHLRLHYETDMTIWEHLYDGSTVIEQGLGETYDNKRESGRIRYLIRAYPLSEKQRTAQGSIQEFVFTKDVKEGYDHEVTLDLLPGNYSIRVWSDLTENSNRTAYYNADNLAEIALQGEHEGNNDYRDAFRGTNDVSLVADIMERVPDTLDITMQRPLAKFEFITNDVVDFVAKEAIRIALKNKEEVETKAIRVEDYKVMFHYVGFMPDTYSLYTDKPVDSSTGVFFESTLEKLNEIEASLGFDYVLVNDKKSAVTVQIGIYDNEDTQLSLSEPIEVPLKRSHHTILRGMFLMSEASGGITINPEFDGEFNLIIP